MNSTAAYILFSSCPGYLETMQLGSVSILIRRQWWWDSASWQRTHNGSPRIVCIYVHMHGTCIFIYICLCTRTNNIGIRFSDTPKYRTFFLHNHALAEPKKCAPKGDMELEWLEWHTTATCTSLALPRMTGKLVSAWVRGHGRGSGLSWGG